MTNLAAELYDELARLFFSVTFPDIPDGHDPNDPLTVSHLQAINTDTNTDTNTAINTIVIADILEAIKGSIMITAAEAAGAPGRERS